MFFGAPNLVQPLKVLADVGSLTVIALARFGYRPVLGIALLVLAAGRLILLRKTFKHKAV